MLYSVYVVNKAGSLLFDYTTPHAQKLPSNERLTLLSMFHGLSAIAVQLSPTNDAGGIRLLEADTFCLYSFVALTGINFVVVAEPGTPAASMDQLLRKMYELYTDYALKNPFYGLDNPIRCELFDQHVAQLVENAERSGAWRSSDSPYRSTTPR